MRNSNARPALREAAEGIHRRLQTVVEGHSQAEVARRTGTTAVSVGRYVRGARLPAEFCNALVREFGLNPSWLLMGEGEQHLADISAGTVRMAGDLLALVEAMSAVARMRLGALAGRSQRKMLRELSDALSSYERLRGRLNEHSRGIFAGLLDELRSALRDLEVERATRLLAPAQQVSRLCDDEELHRSLLQLQIRHLQLSYQVDQVAPLVRRLLLAAPELDDVTLEAIVSVSMALHSQGLTQQAAGIVRAALALAGEHPADRPITSDLQFLRGHFTVELGGLREGLADAHAALPFVSASRRAAARAIMGKLHMLAGLTTPVELLRSDGLAPLLAVYALRFAVFTGQRDALAAGVEFARSRLPGTYANMPVVACAKLLLAAGAKPGAGLLREVRAHGTVLRHAPGSQTLPHEYAVDRCTLLIACRQWQEAMAALRSADDSIRALTRGTHPQILRRAQHYRNAVRLAAATKPDARLALLHAEAVEFFEHHIRLGFGGFVAAQTPAT